MVWEGVLLVIVLMWSGVMGGPPGDRILTLPGLMEPLGFELYGGYLNGGNHPQYGQLNLYYFMAMPSEVSVSQAPVITWFQGGPGCSSLMGMLTENGPFALDEQTGTVLEANPWAWNRVSTMVWIESPVSVGYSFDTTGNYSLGDNETFAMNSAALMDLFNKFPELNQGQPWYLSGESYGGHYLPGTAYWLLQIGAPKLPAGFLLGNPWTDDVIDGNSIPLWIYSHSLCSLPTYLEVESACGLNARDLGQPSALSLKHGMYHSARPLEQTLTSVQESCNQALTKMYNEAGQNISQYDVYVPCYYGADFQCLSYREEVAWFNRPDVRAAMHAQPTPWQWAVCSNTLNYDSSWPSMLPVYNELVKNYKILIYSGDVTWNCDALGSVSWINSMQWTLSSPWTNWFDYDGQVGGYVMKWNEIVFATVRDAGHMVPSFQPMRAFALLQNFLSGEFQP